MTGGVFVRMPLDRHDSRGPSNEIAGSRALRYPARTGPPRCTSQRLLNPRSLTPTTELAMQYLQVVNVVMLVKPVEIGHYIWKAIAEAVNYSATLILNVYTV